MVVSVVGVVVVVVVAVVVVVVGSTGPPDCPNAVCARGGCLAALWRRPSRADEDATLL